MSNCQRGWETGRSKTEVDVAVEHCTTDGDSRLYKGVAESMQDVTLSHRVTGLTELVHLSQCHNPNWTLISLLSDSTTFIHINNSLYPKLTQSYSHTPIRHTILAYTHSFISLFPPKQLIL